MSEIILNNLSLKKSYIRKKGVNYLQSEKLCLTARERREKAYENNLF